MKKFLASMTMCTSLSLVLMVPAFAESTASHTPGHTTSTLNTPTPYSTTPYSTTVPGTYNSNFNRMTTDGTYRPYGTDGTYNPYGTYGAYDGTRMNAYRPYNAARTTTRALDTTTRRTSNWGWLGLLGLFGLAGMRSRNRDEIK
ncbi:WGxxGxxG family protein [Cohnella silvisoli]|uniref:WGxxGxxG family protein n=1 Tax=Cohnella silvisoli TaxID=2873699 RepID=A0ABV1L376_9BACL|nr:WGxxGxxG family protein [Cohnella silvisoli]MCD9026131.1 WGxxGxxG-CTERM domain-containing protein [Cohnella silvisoli]